MYACFRSFFAALWAGKHALPPVYSNQSYTQTQSHTLSSLMQPREVMKTNGRVLFPLGPEEELSHQANFILVWPRDSISSGCFYKCWAAPRQRPVMDMRAWWPDGRCWPCNSSSKHLPLQPMILTQRNVKVWVCMQTTRPFPRNLDFISQAELYYGQTRLHCKSFCWNHQKFITGKGKIQSAMIYTN